ncbi:MAG: hypothetical protein ACI4PQ_01055 [Butyricicoccaceae bacterium]
MSELQRLFIFSCFGGLCYPVLEILWRGWTHWTMALAGALCFGVLGMLALSMQSARWWQKCFAGAIAITAIELIFGSICNLALGMGVWDYSSELLNFHGQICIKYSLFWFILSAPAMKIAERFMLR